MKKCKKCNRPLAKYKGNSLYFPISNQKHCSGNCISKDKILPPPPAIKLQS